MSKFSGMTGILTQTAIRAAAIYGWVRLQRDGILRADSQTPLAVAFFIPYMLAKPGESTNIMSLVQNNI